jgi:hypothetical protein
MEAQSVILNDVHFKSLLESINSNSEYTYSLVLYKEYGEFKIWGIDCCDTLKRQDNNISYWNSTINLPNTPYTNWWTKEWIKIFPEIESRIEISDEIITLLSIETLPKKENNFYKHHFVWTLLRASYTYNIGKKIYQVMMKNPELNFLEVLRFFTYINTFKFNRFITTGCYISTNIEKSREILSKNNFKRMYIPMSGISVFEDYTILKNTRGIENKIDVINKYFYILDELGKLDKSGLFLFSKKEVVYRLDDYNKTNTIFKGIGTVDNNNNLRREFIDGRITVETKDVLEYVNKNFTPSNFDFTTYYYSL